MVSTGMQGGCVCENCSLLRVSTGNVEFAAMFAPKPLAMSAAVAARMSFIMGRLTISPRARANA